MRRLATATAVLAVAGGLLLTGCAAGPEAAPAAADQVAVDVMAATGAEGQALTALGFAAADVELQEVAAAAPTPSAGAPRAAATAEPREKARERRAARVLLRRNTLHGEAVVQTRDGAKTVVVQRGAVTALDGDSVTVRSTDGFTLTWTFGPKLRVIERRAAVQPDQVKVGAQVGVAGAKDGTATVARLIVIPNR